MLKAKMLTIAVILVCCFGTNIAQAENTNNSTSKRVQIVNNYLSGSPMAGIGKILEKEGSIHNVSPYFIVAVAKKESSKGFAACSENKYNVWGLGACDRAWKVPKFKNWTQAVNYFVRFVNGKTAQNKGKGWPSASNPHQFYGYCSGCESEWSRVVSWVMYSLSGTNNIRIK